MKFDPVLVVNSPPINQGFVLNGTHADSRLGKIFIHVNHPAIKCASRVEVRVQLAAERKQQHDRLQTFLALREDAAKQFQG